jgi:hypothetical protein
MMMKNFKNISHLNCMIRVNIFLHFFNFHGMSLTFKITYEFIIVFQIVFLKVNKELHFYFLQA